MEQSGLDSWSLTLRETNINSGAGRNFECIFGENSRLYLYLNHNKLLHTVNGANGSSAALNGALACFPSPYFCPSETLERKVLNQPVKVHSTVFNHLSTVNRLMSECETARQWFVCSRVCPYSSGTVRWRSLWATMLNVRSSCPPSPESLFTLFQQLVSEQLWWDMQRFPLQTHTVSMDTHTHTVLTAARQTGK